MNTQPKANAAVLTRTVKRSIVKEARTTRPHCKTPDNSLEKPGGHAFIDHERREAMIRERAYAYCEARGASCGRELEDWLQAERDVDAALSRSV